MIGAWESLVAKTNRKLEVVTLAFSSKKVNLFTKILIAMFYWYAASPLDLIPDSIPFFGTVDDILIIPVAYALAKLTIKKDVWEELKNQADEENIEVRKIDKIIGGCVVGTLTIALLCLIIYLIVR